MNKYLLICTVAAILLITSCKKNEPEPTPAPNSCDPTYTVDIKPITDSKCAISGCHDANSTVADFTKYSELKVRADNGRLRQYILEQKIMPPATATQLTAEELDLFKCWLDNGAKEG